MASIYARERDLDPDEILNLVVAMALAGMVGARILYLAETDPGALVDPGELIGSRGFSFYGGLIGGVLAAFALLRARGLDLRYLDVLAVGFPLGMAVGRVGDVINGEHFGPASDLPWAFRYLHPDADVPSAAVAYHSGGFYEIVLALIIFAVIWPLRSRLLAPGLALALVVGLYATGRFAMFFVRDDSDTVALGLSSSHLISLVLLAVSLAGIALAVRSARANPVVGSAGPTS